MIFKKEAAYYQKDNEIVICKLCPHECKILNNKKGICGSRINKDGTLYSTSYANPVALNIDPIEKKPLFHFLPSSLTYSLATIGCNLRCLNCQNFSISQNENHIDYNEKFLPEKIVQNAIYNNCKSISYTYTEPTIFYEYMFDIATSAKSQNIKNVFISSGFINEKPLLDLIPFLDAANIDLKVFDDDIYKKLTSAKLDDILRTIKLLHQNKVWVEITNLVIPDWSDDLNLIKKMCKWLVDNSLENIPLHFSKFSPLYKLNNLNPTPHETLKKAKEIALNEGIKFVYVGNIRDTDDENTFCPSCKKLLVKRNGFNVLKNQTTENKCPDCKTLIHGIW